MCKMGDTLHRPIDKRILNSKPFHTIEVKHKLIHVIHGGIGSYNHKLFVQSDLGRVMKALS